MSDLPYHKQMRVDLERMNQPTQSYELVSLAFARSTTLGAAVMRDLLLLPETGLDENHPLFGEIYR